MKKRHSKKSDRIAFHIVTLFPEAFSSYVNESILKRAIKEKAVSVTFYNPRDFTNDKWARVDRRPYGGGPGMVLEAPSVLKAVKKALGRKDRKKVKIIYFEPEGTQFTTKYAEKIRTSYSHIILICGRYEGVDVRVKKALRAEGITIGPYVLTGGELPAMVVLDTIARRIPGVLGDDTSVEERRIAGREIYTRPEKVIWNGKTYRVPKVLLSGNHKEIEKWKQATRAKK